MPILVVRRVCSTSSGDEDLVDEASRTLFAYCPSLHLAMVKYHGVLESSVSCR